MLSGISTEIPMNLSKIEEDTKKVVEGLLLTAHLEEGDILVVGCSSSEVASHSIGSFSSEEIGKVIFETIKKQLEGTGIYLAAQCCEHLNRALILEKKAAKEKGLAIVNVMPVLKAGGSFATAAFHGMETPAAVESLQAQAGIDIGDTLIGMHLAPVAVPVRLEVQSIGNAHVVCARTRPKYIGGERAQYQK